ncbi:RNA polymerase sigma factor [Streptomyces sp. SID4913]|uniref:RNA polymerase sigma factor n=1 Tax=Streptomyces sp. SID4913 TaxID=2690266 RepID=UPI00037F069F|nr:RNA polymerase sigma factor [Streptomyces sp. SID4913]MYY06425.1 sigma-70 family RNA polymerase sigma factor [Streptomyces sp. SID4913]
MRARIRAGDPDAFGALFDDYAQTVFRYAVRSTGDWSGGEDVVSLTFLEAWRLRGTLRESDEELKPWLLGIATNVLRNTRRAARRHEAALARMPAGAPVPDFADELVSRIHDAEQLAAAQAALRRLKPKEREVFLLCVWDGLDYRGAARALGVPVGTVRSRLSRARKRLRGLTEDEREKISGNMELPGSAGQYPSDRATAVRSNEREGNR